jgi:hypothetical protein
MAATTLLNVQVSMLVTFKRLNCCTSAVTKEGDAPTARDAGVELIAENAVAQECDLGSDGDP